MLDLLVTHPPQVQPYLGVEHRIESIHIHVFTHQLQQEISEGLRVGPLGLPGYSRVAGTARQQRRAVRAEAAWACCHSEEDRQNWGPCLQTVPKECPRHTARVSGERGGAGPQRQAAAPRPGSGAKAEGLQGPGHSPALGPWGLPSGLRPTEQRPHLCHLDHVGELSEAGDGDDVVVCPALGPGRRKPTLRGEEEGKGDGSPAPASKTRRGRPPGGPEGRRGQGWLRR